MTSELDLMQRYMDAAPQPVLGDLANAWQVLEAAITEEVVGGQPSVVSHRGATLRRVTRAPLGRSVIAVAAAAVIVAVVLSVVGTPKSPPPTPSGGKMAWRLVSSTTSPFRSLPPGGQPNLQCVTDLVCYSPAGNDPDSVGFYRTSDAGEIWQQMAPIPLKSVNLGSQISCPQADTCAVAGSPTNPVAGQLTELAVTTDGGVHWNTWSVPLPSGIPNPFPGRFSCADGLHCVVNVGGNPAGPNAAPSTTPQYVGTFLSTSDGGKTWTQATSVPSAAAGSVWTMTCSADGSCVAVSALGGFPNSYIVGLSSHDWGRTWTAGPPSVYNSAPIMYASCPDTSHCMLVPLSGPSKAPFEIATTADAGQTWQVSGPPSGWQNMPTAVSCATGDDCWIAMSTYDTNSPAGAYSDPTIEATYDGGLTWSSIPLPSHQPPISDVLTLSCPPSGDGCMGIGNLEDHFVLPSGPPHQLSGPLVISNLPTAGPNH
jgi:photosystem II stability/assembly factor-like uncharacterized protein